MNEDDIIRIVDQRLLEHRKLWLGGLIKALQALRRTLIGCGRALENIDGVCTESKDTLPCPRCGKEIVLRNRQGRCACGYYVNY